MARKKQKIQFVSGCSISADEDVDTEDIRLEVLCLHKNTKDARDFSQETIGNCYITVTTKVVF
jgi:hypothetical protein